MGREEEAITDPTDSILLLLLLLLLLKWCRKYKIKAQKVLNRKPQTRNIFQTQETIYPTI